VGEGGGCLESEQLEKILWGREKMYQVRYNYDMPTHAQKGDVKYSSYHSQPGNRSRWIFNTRLRSFYQQEWTGKHITFVLPCIVMDFFLNNQPDAIII